MEVVLKFESTRAARNRLDVSKTKYYSDIEQGFLPPPIPTGIRRVTTLSHETDVIIAARAAGKNDVEIKKIVLMLIEKRQTILDDLLAEVIK